MDEIEKIKKKLRKTVQENIEVDEDSDIVVHERRTKDKKLRQL